MPLRVSTAASTGRSLYADFERLSDGFWLENSGNTWTANPAAGLRKFALAEGTGSYVGSYTLALTLAAAGADAGWVRVRVHDEADAADRTLAQQDVYVVNGSEVTHETVLSAIALLPVVPAVAVATPEPGELVAVRGDTFAVTLSGLGSLAGAEKLWVTAKRNENQPDSAALFQIEETDGLLVFNGAPAADAALGDLTVTDPDEGNISITVDETLMALLTPLEGKYDVQKLVGGVVRTVAIGDFRVTPHVTHATS